MNIWKDYEDAGVELGCYCKKMLTVKIEGTRIMELMSKYVEGAHHLGVIRAQQ